MKKLQNNFTTIEQSKRLLELGIPADSADFYWTHEHKRGVLPRIENILTTFTEEQKNHYTYNVDDYIIPCWSAGRLIEIFDLCLDSKRAEAIGVQNDSWDFYESEGKMVEFIIAAFERCHKLNLLGFSKLEN